MKMIRDFGQDLFYGADTLRHLPGYLAKAGVDNCILVRGKESFPGEMDEAYWNGVKVEEFVIDAGRPDINLINDRYELLKPKLPLHIVAVGGGMVMDTAKTILYHSIKDGQSASILIAVPTTAGSGSEATPFAVVYDGKVKQSLEHTSLLPAAVFLDPLTIATLPAKQKAISGLDAWCQAIESYWSNRATVETKSLSEKAFAILSKQLPQSLIVKDATIDGEIQLGAHYAGQAIRKTYTTGAHALSYYLTAEYDISHGQAVGIFLPVMILYNSYWMKDENKIAGLLNLLAVKTAGDAIEHTLQFIRSIGLSATLKELQLPLDVNVLVNSVNMQRFSNNPRPYDKDALIECIQWSLNAGK